MKPEEAKDIKEHFDTFHNLMIVVLRRRALFRVFEKKLIGKGTQEEIYRNAFIAFYMMDYSRAQLVDLRKFFETDKSSYKISYLISLLVNLNLRKEHKRLFGKWKKIQNKVNKTIAHLDKDYENIDKQVRKKDVDDFIDELNHFLDDIASVIRTTGTLIFDKKFRDLNGDFLNKDHEKSSNSILIGQNKAQKAPI